MDGSVRQMTPINRHSAADVSMYHVCRGPTPGFAEQVCCLRLWADKNDQTKVILRDVADSKAVSMADEITSVLAGRQTQMDKRPLPE